MKKVTQFKQWFSDLSRAGKFGFISALVVSGLIVASATASPSTPAVVPVSNPTPASETQEEGREPVITEKTEVEKESIPYSQRTVESDELSKGTTQLETAGVNGEKTITHTITLTDGVETERSSVSVVTKKPVDEVTLLGTYVKPVSNCNPNYSGCVPNVAYDLDCPDIGYSVTVIGYDQYRLDGDDDGYGCESY